MSYGQNQPWGLMAVKTTNGSTWNGQTSQYLIQSGYTWNIFRGDLVYQGSDGYIHNLADLGSGPLATAQAIGVFNGCSFVTTTATNPIDPASPGRPYWPAGTITANNQNATCDIIDDPSVIFNIQAGAALVGGIPFNAQGSTASVGYTFINGSTNISGNFQTGISTMVLNAIGNPLAGQPQLNLRILRFVPYSGNGQAITYNNVEVLIQNHSFAQRAPGL